MEILKNKKKIILALLVFLFAVALVYRVTHPFKQPKIDNLKYTGGETAGPEKKAGRKDTVASSVEAPLLKLDVFLNPPEHSRKQIRDLFYDQAGMDNSAAGSDKEKADQSSGGTADQAVIAGRVEEDLGIFRSFGYMERGGERILFIEKGKQIMLVRKGDRIEDKYLVKEITENELTLTVISSNESVRIDISGL